MHKNGYKHYIWETQEINIDNSELSEKISSKSKKQEKLLRDQIDKDNKVKVSIQQSLKKLERNKAQIENY